MSGVAAGCDTTQGIKGYKEAGKRSATDGPPARPNLKSTMKVPMMSELQRINALNLEPSLPKLDDKPWPHDWKKTRQTIEAVEGDRKNEFLHSLEVINRSTVQPLGARQRQRTRPQTMQVKQTTDASLTSTAKNPAGSSREQYEWQ